MPAERGLGSRAPKVQGAKSGASPCVGAERDVRAPRLTKSVHFRADADAGSVRPDAWARRKRERPQRGGSGAGATWPSPAKGGFVTPRAKAYGRVADGPAGRAGGGRNLPRPRNDPKHHKERKAPTPARPGAPSVPPAPPAEFPPAQ